MKLDHQKRMLNHSASQQHRQERSKANNAVFTFAQYFVNGVYVELHLSISPDAEQRLFQHEFFSSETFTRLLPNV